MSYLEKYSKYKSKYLYFKNQFGGTITCTPQIIDGDGIDVIIHDNNLPGDLRSSVSDGTYVAWFSWFPHYRVLNDSVNWTIRSDSYDQVQDEHFEQVISNKELSKDKQLFSKFMEIEESTELQLYKNKYDKLFRIMAINELYKFPEFQEWAKTHSL
jgi:hypothetical protein